MGRRRITRGLRQGSLLALVTLAFAACGAKAPRKYWETSLPRETIAVPARGTLARRARFVATEHVTFAMRFRPQDGSAPTRVRLALDDSRPGCDADLLVSVGVAGIPELLDASVAPDAGTLGERDGGDGADGGEGSADGDAGPPHVQIDGEGAVLRTACAPGSGVSGVITYVVRNEGDEAAVGELLMNASMGSRDGPDLPEGSSLDLVPEAAL